MKKQKHDHPQPRPGKENTNVSLVQEIENFKGETLTNSIIDCTYVSRRVFERPGDEFGHRGTTITWT